MFPYAINLYAVRLILNIKEIQEYGLKPLESPEW